MGIFLTGSESYSEISEWARGIDGLSLMRESQHETGAEPEIVLYIV
jgi:hypothetical protein